MRKVEDILQKGLVSNVQSELDEGGGGGGGNTNGGGGGGSQVVITQIPNTPLSNFSGKLQINCVVGDIATKTYSGEKI